MESLDELVTQAQGLSGRPDDLAHLQGLLQGKGSDILERSTHSELERVLELLEPETHSLAWLYVLDALVSVLSRSFPSTPAPARPQHYQQQQQQQHGEAEQEHPDQLVHVASASASPLHAAGIGAAEQVVSSCSTFISLCSAAQIRLDPLKFTGLCRQLKRALLLLGAQEHSIRGVLPLLTALRKLQPTPEHLTPLHSDFLQLCLLAHCYSAGYHLLCSPPAAPTPNTNANANAASSSSSSGVGAPTPGLAWGAGADGDAEEQLICEIEPAETGVSQTDFLLFCYYGGMVCIGMRKLHQASRLFLYAISAPAVGLSAITVAAYKKYLLLALILHGKLPPLPRYTPSAIQRQLKTHAQEYVEVAEAYPKRGSEEMQALIQKHQEVFKGDSNMGLAKQVLSSVSKRSILRLTQTYLTLSLHDIAHTVNLANARQAELYILRMIQDGDIHASISQKERMVSFKEDPERYNTYRMALSLNTHILRTLKLNRRLESMESSLACDRMYLQRVLREKTSRFGDPDEMEYGGSSRVFESPM